MYIYIYMYIHAPFIYTYLGHRLQRSLEQSGGGEIRLVLCPRQQQRRHAPQARRQLHLYLLAHVAVVEDSGAVALVVHLDFDPLRFFPQRAHQL